MIQLSRSIKKAWDPGPRMQDAVVEDTEQPNLLPLFYSEKGMSRSGWALSIDIHWPLLFWHPNPGRVFPLGRPLRALDIFSGGNQNQTATPRSLIQQFLE